MSDGERFANGSNNITTCTLCRYALDEAQRKEASIEPSSPNFNVLLYAEHLFSHWSFQPLENVAENVAQVLRSVANSVGDREEKRRILELTTADVLRHFRLHHTPSLKEILLEQLFVYKCIQNSYVRNFWNTTGDFSWNVDASGSNFSRVKCLKMICDEVRKIANEAAAANYIG